MCVLGEVLIEKRVATPVSVFLSFFLFFWCGELNKPFVWK